MSLKNPVTPPGIHPGTVRLVAQRLNHYATPGPKRHTVGILISAIQLFADVFLSLASFVLLTFCNHGRIIQFA